jgi:hypothetical protein
LSGVLLICDTEMNGIAVFSGIVPAWIRVAGTTAVTPAAFANL